MSSAGRSGFVSLIGRPNSGKSTLLLLNKIDKLKKQDLLPQIDHYSQSMKFDEIIPISAKTGENVELFLKALFQFLPAGPRFYSEDQFSDQNERTLVSEIIREK